MDPFTTSRADGFELNIRVNQWLPTREEAIERHVRRKRQWERAVLKGTVATMLVLATLTFAAAALWPVKIEPIQVPNYRLVR